MNNAHDFDDDFDDDLTELEPCPHCGAQIYEDSEMCPVCGDYIVHAWHAWSGRPTWWIILGLLGVIAVIVVLASGC